MSDSNGTEKTPLNNNQPNESVADSVTGKDEPKQFSTDSHGKVINGNMDLAVKKQKKKSRFSSRTRFRIRETILRFMQMFVPCLAISVILAVLNLAGIPKGDPFSVTLSTLLALLIFTVFAILYTRSSFFLLYGHKSYYITNLAAIGLFSLLNLAFYKGCAILFTIIYPLGNFYIVDIPIEGGIGFTNFLFTWFFAPAKFFRNFPMLQEWGWGLNNGHAALIFDGFLLVIFLLQTLLLRAFWIRKPKEFKAKNEAIRKKKNKRRKESLPTDI